VRTIFINGRFASQPTTGVQRVAKNLLRALDHHVADAGLPSATRWVLLCPPGCPTDAFRALEPRVVGRPGLPLHLWEQAVLPFAARGGLLLNLAGSAPRAARRQVAMLHDAAVFDRPQAYTKPFVWWYRSLFRSLALHAGRLLTVSDFSRQRLALQLGLDACPLSVVPNGCDHLDAVAGDDSVLRELGLQPDRYFLAVSSSNANKNLAALVKAFGSMTAEPHLKLVIAGGHNERVFAASAAGGVDPPGVVRAGPVDDARLKALYQHATALVFPSLYEGFGLPPLEAMACGCPVAAARAGAVPEVCGEAALYFDPTSTQEIASAMTRLQQEPSLRLRLRQAGAARAGQFRWAESARILHSLLQLEPTA